MAIAYVGLGANLGEPRVQLAWAVQRLHALPNSRVRRLSSLKSYPAVGGPPQPDYLNAVVELSTTLPPDELVRQCQALERTAGRPQPDPVRWGPRVLDLDLLLYEDRVIDTPELTVPHPRLAERRFVLEPLAELVPNFIHPVLHAPVAVLLKQFGAQSP